MSDTILSALASKQISVASEDGFDSVGYGKVEDSSDEETENSSIEPAPSNSQEEESRLSSLTSSSWSEAVAMAGDSGEHLTYYVIIPYF